GGETMSDPLKAKRIKEIWEDFPETNIYHVENEFFDLVQIRKPKEFPLDFVLRGYPYFILVLTVASILYWVRVVQGRASVNIRAILISAALSFAIMSLSKTIYKNYTNRLNAG